MNRTLPGILFCLMLAACSDTGNPDPAPNAIVDITTTMGVITIQLNGDKAPATVNNFLNYVQSGHYNGTIFHRVIAGFMIQGGGLTTSMQEKSTGSPVVNESENGLKNIRGSIAMARRSDPDSATAQFFINHADNAFLDYPSNGGYTVFGQVTAGMGVVDAIAQVATGNSGFYENVPVVPIVIQNIQIR